jgi:hypothetical protein
MNEPIIKYKSKKTELDFNLLFHLNKSDVHIKVLQQVLLAKHQQIEFFESRNKNFNHILFNKCTNQLITS